MSNSVSSLETSTIKQLYEKKALTGSDFMIHERHD